MPASFNLNGPAYNLPIKQFINRTFTNKVVASIGDIRKITTMLGVLTKDRQDAQDREDSSLGNLCHSLGKAAQDPKDTQTLTQTRLRTTQNMRLMLTVGMYIVCINIYIANGMCIVHVLSRYCYCNYIDAVCEALYNTV